MTNKKQFPRIFIPQHPQVPSPELGTKHRNHHMILSYIWSCNALYSNNLSVRHSADDFLHQKSPLHLLCGQRRLFFIEVNSLMQALHMIAISQHQFSYFKSWVEAEHRAIPQHHDIVKGGVYASALFSSATAKSFLIIGSPRAQSLKRESSVGSGIMQHNNRLHRKTSSLEKKGPVPIPSSPLIRIDGFGCWKPPRQVRTLKSTLLFLFGIEIRPWDWRGQNSNLNNMLTDMETSKRYQTWLDAAWAIGRESGALMSGVGVAFLDTVYITFGS